LVSKILSANPGDTYFNNAIR